MAPVILWFRQDLRLQDNAALAEALKRDGAILPVYIWDEAGEREWAPGAASRWWLHGALTSLAQTLREAGSRLLVKRGDTLAVLVELAEETGARTVLWNRRYEPAAVAQEKAVLRGLEERGIKAASFNSALLFEPDAVEKKQGGPFQVFTPFWRHCLSLPVPEPVKITVAHLSARAPKAWPRALPLGELGLLPREKWDAGLHEVWHPGEKAAQLRLKHFLRDIVGQYAEGRDYPAKDAVSMLSAHLHFGEIGPRQIWAAVRAQSKENGIFPPNKGAQKFLTELGWREFAHHLLWYFPHTPRQPLRAEYSRFPWADDPGGLRLRAWQRGLTGYPIVDAGMRQLWQTGWMHNRVRMVAASFLVKHLRLSWTHGASWFLDTLVDADLANNTLGWQWSAGCGADAAPYFRVFAPVLQGERFDKAGAYVRRWVPELAQLPDAYVHRPWEAPPELLASAGIVLGKSYPLPLVEHGQARAKALKAFKNFRNAQRQH